MNLFITYTVVSLTLKLIWIAFGIIGFILIVKDGEWGTYVSRKNTYEIIGSICFIIGMLVESVLLGPVTFLFWYNKIKIFKP